MYARRWFWLGGIVIALLAGQGTALAGGLVVSLDHTPVDVVAGQPFTVGFMIRSMHDGQGFSDLTPQVVATKVGSKEQLTVEAKPEGAVGHYIATVTLPAEGEWNWQIRPFGSQGGDYPNPVFAPLHVRVAALAQPPDASLAPSIALWFTLLALLALGAAAITFLLRRRVLVSS